MLFGCTTTKLLRYLAPLESTDFVDYGYNTTALEELLEEKAQIVFSYLPRKYQRLYKARVNRMIIVPYAFEGQDEVATPYDGLEDVTAYLNPTGTLDELKDQDTIAVVVDDGLNKMTFTALTLGDKVVIDFSADITDLAIPELIWACNALAGADLMSIISGETKTASILPRVKSDMDRVIPWLQALNSPSQDDRVIIKQLDFDFYEGSKDFSDRIDDLQKRFIDGIPT